MTVGAAELLNCVLGACSMKQSEERKPESAKSKALGIFGALVGIAVSRYSGANLLMPLAATALVWWGGKKLLKDTKLLFLP